MPEDIGKLDANMRVPEITGGAVEDIAWHDPAEKPFRLAGFPWFDEEHIYRRLPRDERKRLPLSVDLLADCTAGGALQFKTDSNRILLEVELTSHAGRMYHMAPTGESGFDLYRGEPGSMKYAKTTMFQVGDKSYSAILMEPGEPVRMREFKIHFPLYNGVKKLRIGLQKGAAIAPPGAYSGKRIVVYGGSTVQGACASRPGRCTSNIIARELNREVVNLGFSGSGKMEPVLAEMIADIPDMGLLMIEAERNTGYEGMAEKLSPFLELIRKRHPALPIVLWSANPHGAEHFQNTLRHNRRRLLELFRHTVGEMRDPRLYLFDSSELLGEDLWECSVDGLHPTDLGFSRMADGILPFIRKILLTT